MTVYINEANEDDALNGKYKEPKIKTTDNIAEKWYLDNLAGKGYGTIAREHYKLDIISDNDSDEVKKERKQSLNVTKTK